MALLEVSDLRVSFTTDDGQVRAVNGLSYAVERGATLGIVGESGSGKSVNALSIMRLIPPPGTHRVRGDSACVVRICSRRASARCGGCGAMRSR